MKFKFKVDKVFPNGHRRTIVTVRNEQAGALTLWPDEMHAIVFALRVAGHDVQVCSLNQKDKE